MADTPREFDERVGLPNFGMVYKPLIDDTTDDDLAQLSALEQDGGDEGLSFDGNTGEDGAEQPFIEPPDRRRNDEGVGFPPSPSLYLQETANRDVRDRKPHAFALAHGEAGASIWFGVLLVLENIESGGSAGDDLPGTKVIIPDNLETDHLLQTHLEFYGNVYLYWEVDESRDVVLCRVLGPTDPKLSAPITPGAQQFSVLIGTVDEGDPVDQIISSDVPWMVQPLDESSGSSGSSGDLSSSDGSSKDSAIVPGLNGKYRKWYTMEATDVRFFEFTEAIVPNGTTRIPIDPEVMFGLERHTARVFVQQERGIASGRVKDGQIEVKSLHLPFPRTQCVQIMLHAIRRGFERVRLEFATFDEFVDNEHRLNPRMTRKQVVKALAFKGITS